MRRTPLRDRLTMVAAYIVLGACTKPWRTATRAALLDVAHERQAALKPATAFRERTP